MTKNPFEFRFCDLVGGHENPEDGFRLGVAIATFWAAQRDQPSPEHDRILDHVETDKLHAIPMLMTLSLVDPIFFDLSQRMAARTLVKQQGNVGKMVGKLAVIGLTHPRPNVANSKIARDLGILVSLGSTCRLGLAPTERKSKKAGALIPDSGSRRFYELAVQQELFRGVPSTTQISEVWGRRQSTLLRAGFSEEDVYRFSADFSGTTLGT